MILFADTSALVKLYVEETGSAEMSAAVAAATAVAVARIAWVETMAAFARRAREQAAASAALALARQRFIDDWSGLLVVEITQPVVQRAGDYAEAFALRAYDSVQLAALQALRLQADEEVRFACFDSRLVRAAAVLGAVAAW